MPESVKKAMKDKYEQWAARIAAARANKSNDNLQNVPPTADRPWLIYIYNRFGAPILLGLQTHHLDMMILAFLGEMLKR